MKSPELIFQEESADLFEELEVSLLQLEQHSDSKAIIERVLQLFHAAKVLSTVSGLSELARLVLIVLAVLNRVKEGKISITTEFISLALRTKDHLQEIIEKSVSDPEMDIGNINDLIHAWENIPISQQTGGREFKASTTSRLRAGPPNILIVDDEYINRSLLEETIRSCSKEVNIVSVDTASEALYFYFTKEFDLVFLDIMIPEVDGNDFIAIVQKNRDAGHLTKPPNIIVQTAIQSMEHLMSYVRRECIQEVIRKPLPVDRVTECVERYCF